MLSDYVVAIFGVSVVVVAVIVCCVRCFCWHGSLFLRFVVVDVGVGVAVCCCYELGAFFVCYLLQLFSVLVLLVFAAMVFL